MLNSSDAIVFYKALLVAPPELLNVFLSEDESDANPLDILT